MKNLYMLGLVLAAVMVRKFLVMTVMAPLAPVPVKPNDFPSDIPVLQGAELKESDKRQGTTFATYVTAERPASVGVFYETELRSQGWTVERYDPEENEGRIGVNAEKDNRGFVAIVTPEGNGGSKVSVVFR